MSKQHGWLTLALVLATAQLAGALELAVLPPVQDEAVATALRTAAAEVGVSVTVLDPAQLVDRERFSPQVYGMAILVGGTHYPDTVVNDGDAGTALQAYVEAGGSLLVAATGSVMSRPQRWNGTEWQSSPAPLRRVGLQTHLGLLDAGQLLESAPPAGCEYVTGPRSPLAARLPERFARAVDGAPYGPVPSSQEAAIEFTPIATLVDAQGGTYGAGLAEMRRRDAAPRGGSVYYCWAPLLTGGAGRDVLLGLLALNAQRTLKAEDAQRQQELLQQLGALESRHASAVAILPSELHNAEVDRLRELLVEQADSLHWLREATLVGNLNFVAVRMVKLREELADLPRQVGLAVDNAVLDVVAQPGGAATAELPVEPPQLSPGGAAVVSVASQSPEVAPPAVSPSAGGPAAAAAPAVEPRAESVPVPDPMVTEPATAVGHQPDAAPAVEPATPAAPAGVSTPAEPAAPGTEARPTEPEKMFKDIDGPVIEFDVANRGKLYLELFPKEAPKTCSAFLYLVRSGFYERTYFHRREEGFVVQGGDPYTRDLPPDHQLVGTGGPDWTVPGEFQPGLHHVRGSVGLARAPSDPDSGGSQFYICLEKQSSLDGKYCVFGQVIGGLDVLDAIQVGDRVTTTKVVQGAALTNPEGVRPLEIFSQKQD